MQSEPSLLPARELAKLAVAEMQDVLLARLVGRQEATRLGFAPLALTQIATAISEMARNVVQHSGAAGVVTLSERRQEGRRGLLICIEDAGRGIADLDRHQAGAPALGAGIPGTRHLMDEFDLQSVPGRGTRVQMTKWLK